MRLVNMLEAKSSLSRLVEAVESGRETEIIIARNGKPAAKLTSVDARSVGQRLGVGRGRFTIPDDIDADNAEIAELFNGPQE